MGLLKGHKKDDNISILSVFNRRPTKDQYGNWTDRVFTVLYKNLDTGEVHRLETKKPSYLYYKLKPQYSLDHEMFTNSMDYYDEAIVPFNKLEYNIAKDHNDKDYLESSSYNRYEKKKELHASHYDIAMSDISLESNFMLRFDKEYKNDIFNPTVAYFDIEVDTRYAEVGVIPQDGTAPINTISYINDELDKVEVHVVANNDNKSSMKFFNKFKSDSDSVISKLKDCIKEHVGDKLYDRVCTDTKYYFYFYDNDKTLLINLFKNINKDKPNFMLAWNMAYDVPYIINRLKVLGMNPADVMCHKDFKYPTVSYNIDNLGDIRSRNDSYEISSYTVYLDQMIQFACRRSNDTSIGSYALDNIGHMVCNVGKLDWRLKYKSFSEFLESDFEMFVFYNIMDTMVQRCIEKSVDDMSYLLAKSIQNCTPIKSIHQQSVYLHARAHKIAHANGLVLTNNYNIHTPKGKYPGGFTADNTLIDDTSKLCVDGEYLRIFPYAFDYDAKSLYPNEVRQFNISKSTMVGHVEVESSYLENENLFKEKHYRRSGKLLDDLSVNNPILYGKNWLGLGGFKQILGEFMEFVNNKSGYNFDRNMYKDEVVFDVLYDDEVYETQLYFSDNKVTNKEIIDKVNSINLSDVLDLRWADAKYIDEEEGDE